MATIKSYTDIDQSKKLTEILPLESADMLFQLGEDKYADSIRVPLTNEHWKQMMPDIKPCWSLTALLTVLPNIGACAPILVRCLLKNKYYCHYLGIGNYKEVHTTDSYDNPIDACYEMIIKLHELNLL